MGLERKEGLEGFEGDVEEIFRFNVFLTKEQEIEIGVNIMELSIDGEPEFGEQYGYLAHIFAELVTEHLGIDTEILMSSVSELQAQDIELSDEEKAILAADDTDENGSVLLYSFPILLMGKDNNEDGSYDKDEMNLGVGFERSPKAEVIAKVYGDSYMDNENIYHELVTDSILDHGTLFVKAVESIQKL